MGEMFKSKSDLSGLLKNATDLKVSKAVHKAVIEVNEEGSEAAGTTGKNAWFDSNLWYYEWTGN